VAKALDLAPSTVSRWAMPHPRGTGGKIPQRHWPRLYVLAQKVGVRVAANPLHGLVVVKSAT